MIINFSNLGGGGGGGSYTLPVATASRLGGIKVGSGLDITPGGVLSVTGGSSSDGQKLWTAATPADMASLTGVSEGDVCMVSAYYDEMPENFSMYLDWGWGFFSAWLNTFPNDVPPSLRFTFVENQYWDGVDASTTPTGSYVEFGYTHENEQQVTVTDYNAIKCDSNDGYQYFSEKDQEFTPDPSAYTTFSGVDDSFVVDSSHSFNSASAGGDSDLFEHSSNTTYKYVVKIEQEVAAATYQLNNGEWIQLASADAVASAMTAAQDAANTAYQMVSKNGMGISDWSDLTYADAFIGEVSVNNVSQGYRIHVMGANTERTNPKVTELVTSGDVAKIVALTQDEYDQMQTHDNNTLYAIIPDTN